MKRFFFESLIGLVLLFILSLVGYAIIEFEIGIDDSIVLSDTRSEAYGEVLKLIVAQNGDDTALQILQNFTKKTHQRITPYNADTLPEHINQLFLGSDDSRLFFKNYIDEDIYWFRFANSQQFYRIDDDPNSLIIQSLNEEEAVIWLFFFGSFIVYCFLLILVFSWRVRALEKVTLNFAAGDLAARAPQSGMKRVGKLNHSFNHMADKIATLIASNRTLTNAVAHELRTPLFKIQWQAEILADTQLNAEQHELNSDIIKNTDDMETIINELLYFASVERPDAELLYQSIDMNNWLLTLADEWQTESDVDIKLSLLPQETAIAIDQRLLHRAFDNIVRNGFRYARSTIQITLELKNKYLLLSINNDGDSIDEQHWPHLFDAFYSADPARNKAQSGHGLGLAIAKQIVNRHHGHIEVCHSSLGGASFQLQLPLTH